MKTLRLSLLSFCFVAVALVANTVAAAPTTVQNVDVTQFLGTWYQIAHKPLWFEGGNCPCAKQELAHTSDPKKVSVYNSCTDGDHRQNVRTIRGTATPDDASNSKFTVWFQGVWIPGSYWIIGVDPQYRFAVVSDRWSYSLYILSKTTTLPDDLYQQALQMAQSQVSLSGLEKTDQTNCRYY